MMARYNTAEAKKDIETLGDGETYHSMFNVTVRREGAYYFGELYT